MAASLKLCEILAVEYGYPLEMRRVHLARNFAHVCAYAGEVREALRISAQLLQYIAGTEEAWPLPYRGPTRRPHLEDDAAVLMLDQVLTEVVRLLEPQEPAARDLLPTIATVSELLRSGGPATFRRAAHCLTACIAYVQNDEERFFEEAGAFFETGQQALEFAWHELEKKFLRAAALQMQLPPAEREWLPGA